MADNLVASARTVPGKFCRSSGRCLSWREPGRRGCRPNAAWKAVLPALWVSEFFTCSAGAKQRLASSSRNF
eukprot:6097404-Amphidinium_carterae.5